MMTRRALLASTAAATALAATTIDLPAATSPVRRSSVPPFDLDELTIAELSAGLRDGRWTSLDLVEKYLARIAMIDRDGPRLGSIIEVNPEAIGIARRLDEERSAGKVRGPLHGIPIVIKDNIDTADAMSTTAGSLALAGDRPSSDAPIVTKLREAGAILLAKTNLSEWANFRSTRSTSGWSARGGFTRNPYVLDRNSSGSSAGSGVAVAANLAAAAIGTETDGSIVSPASHNSLVGLKPTVGLVSRTGIIPISHTQDTAGPMTRTVADAALLLDVIAGSDSRDSATAEADRRRGRYADALDANGLSGARIGVVRSPTFNLPAKVDPILEQAITTMKNRGAIVVDEVTVPHLGEYDDEEFEILLYEFKHDLNAYLATRPHAAVKSLADAIAFNERNAGRELEHFDQEIFRMAEKKGSLSEKKYLDALAKARRLSRAEGIDAALKKDRLDALVAISNGPAWLIDPVNGDSYSGGYSSASAVSGYPHITVPAGYVRNLPIGISFFGTAWSESTLLRLAFAFEQASKARIKPSFLPTAVVS